MDWPDRFITIDLDVGKPYQDKLWVYSQRMSNHADLSFTDEEVIAVDLFGVMDKPRAT